MSNDYEVGFSNLTDARFAELMKSVQRDGVDVFERRHYGAGRPRLLRRSQNGRVESVGRNLKCRIPSF